MNLQKLLSAREGHWATIKELLMQFETAIEDYQHDDFELSFQTIKKNFERALSCSNTPPTSHAQEVEDTNQSSVPHTPLPIVPEARDFLPHVSVQLMAHHLPKLTLPTFNRDLMSWPTFWD